MSPDRVITNGEQMKKRMQLTLDAETHALIMELSELSGMSASALVTSMFQLSRERLESALSNLRDAAQTPADVFDDLVKVMKKNPYRKITTMPRRAKGSLTKD